MAKKKKSAQTNVVRKNAWSVVSIWWGILVFGLLIPALFLVACLDINSYKKEVWNHVKDQKDNIAATLTAELNDEVAAVQSEINALQRDISKLENSKTAADAEIENLKAEITSWETKKTEYRKQIASLQAEINALQQSKSETNFPFLDPLELHIKDTYPSSLVGLDESQVSRLMLKTTSGKTYDSVEAEYALSHLDKELSNVNNKKASYTNVSNSIATFDASASMDAFIAQYSSMISNATLKKAFLSSFDSITFNSFGTPMDTLVWDDSCENDATYESMTALIKSLDQLIATLNNVGNLVGPTAGLFDDIQEDIASNPYVTDEIKEELVAKSEESDQIFTNIENSFDSDAAEKLTTLRNEWAEILSKYEERLLIERERSLFYGVMVHVEESVLRFETIDTSIIQTYINTYSADAYNGTTEQALALALKDELADYAQAYYDYRKNSDASKVEYDGIDGIVDTYKKAYTNGKYIDLYTQALENVKTSLATKVGNGIFTKILYGMDLREQVTNLYAEQEAAATNDNLLVALNTWFDKINANIESVNEALSDGDFAAATCYAIDDFRKDKDAFKEEVLKETTEDINKNYAAIEQINGFIAEIDTATIPDLESAITAEESKISGYNNDIISVEIKVAKKDSEKKTLESYHGNISTLQQDLNELYESKNARKYDSMKNVSYTVGKDKTYKIAYNGTGALLGLTAGGGMLNMAQPGLIQNLLNKNNSLNRYQLIATVCLLIAVGFLLLTYIIQIIRIIIAKKTAWIFHDGAVIYRKGRIFYTEEFTRDMEYFPGMSVSVRHTIKGKIFKYGDVILSNGAGEAGEIVMRGVKNPTKVHQMLSRMLVTCCTRTANMMSPYKMYPQMYRHVLGGYPAYYYGAMQMNGMNNTPPTGGK